VKYHGEETAYQYLRGPGFKKNHMGRLEESKEGIAIILPSFRTLQKYTAHSSYSHGINKQFVEEILNEVFYVDFRKTFGISMDEMQIIDGISYDSLTKQIIGFTEEIPVHKAPAFKNKYNNIKDTKTAEKLQKKIATKIMQVFIVSASTGISFPIASYPTIGAGAKKVFFFIFN
jgi:hypothetical protein